MQMLENMLTLRWIDHLIGTGARLRARLFLPIDLPRPYQACPAKISCLARSFYVSQHGRYSAGDLYSSHKSPSEIPNFILIFFRTASIINKS